MKGQVYKKVGQYDRRRPYSRKDAAEFKGGKKGFIVCPDCKNVYYVKSWHHDFPKDILPERRDVRFMICPADKMVKDNRFEGMVVIENVPAEFNQKIIEIIENLGRRATEKDPQDRIIKIQSEERKAQNKIEIFTTENQLAQRIGRRVKETFDHQIRQRIFYSKGNDLVRVRLLFQ